MSITVLYSDLREQLASLPYRVRTGPPLYYRLFDRSQLPQFTPFDEAFPDADKIEYAPAKRVSTPDADRLFGSTDVTHLDRDCYTIPEDYASVATDATICPQNEVLIADEKKIIRESSTAKKLKFLNTRSLYQSSGRYVDGYATMFRSRFHNYFHLLIDVLPRLLTLTRAPWTDVDTIKLLCPDGLTDTESFYLSQLGIENLEPVILDREEGLIGVEKLIFTPFKTRIGAGYIPKNYRDQLRSLLLPDRPSRTSKRIFISREKATVRKLENRESVVDALYRLGFECYVLEDLSHLEQIELFYDAEIVVGAHGAGLSNLLFSPHVHVIELFPYSWMPYPHYYYLALSMGHRYTPIWGSTNSTDYPHPERFSVDTSHIFRALEESGLNRQYIGSRSA